MKWLRTADTSRSGRPWSWDIMPRRSTTPWCIRSRESLITSGMWQNISSRRMGRSRQRECWRGFFFPGRTSTDSWENCPVESGADCSYAKSWWGHRMFWFWMSRLTIWTLPPCRYWRIIWTRSQASSSSCPMTGIFWIVWSAGSSPWRIPAWCSMRAVTQIMPIGKLRRGTQRAQERHPSRRTPMRKLLLKTGKTDRNAN